MKMLTKYQMFNSFLASAVFSGGDYRETLGQNELEAVKYQKLETI